MSNRIVRPSGDTASEVKVPLDTVKSSVRAGSSGSPSCPAAGAASKVNASASRPPSLGFISLPLRLRASIRLPCFDAEAVGMIAGDRFPAIPARKLGRVRVDQVQAPAAMIDIHHPRARERTSVVEGKSGTVSVVLGGRRLT